MTPPAGWDGNERRQGVSNADIVELKDLIVALDTKLTIHIAAEQDVWPAIKELVIIWKGSKLILPFLAFCIAGAWALYEWAKDHLK